MEGSGRDRFRLIYLKSAGPDKSGVSQPVFSHHSEKDESEGFSSYHGPSESLSSQAHLGQAKSDLNHPNPKLRMLAIQSLERMDASIALPLLQEALSDQDSDVRAQALLSLTKFRSPDLKPLIKKFLRDSSPKVRIAALRGIFQFEEGVDLNILLQLLSEESLWVRRKMATLLGWSQTEGVLPILAELSKDPEAKVRKAALSSLVSLYPEESEDRLLKAMADPDPGLRKWARRTLEKIVEAPVIRGEQKKDSVV